MDAGKLKTKVGASKPEQLPPPAVFNNFLRKGAGAYAEPKPLKELVRRDKVTRLRRDAVIKKRDTLNLGSAADSTRESQNCRHVSPPASPSSLLRSARASSAAANFVSKSSFQPMSSSPIQKQIKTASVLGARRMNGQ